MGTLNDEILRATGGPTVNDGLRSWFSASSGVLSAPTDSDQVLTPAAIAADAGYQDPATGTLVTAEMDGVDVNQLQSLGADVLIYTLVGGGLIDGLDGFKLRIEGYESARGDGLIHMEADTDRYVSISSADAIGIQAYLNAEIGNPLRVIFSNPVGTYEFVPYRTVSGAETLQDAELRWLKAQVGVTTATTINDAWGQFLSATPGTLNDKLLAYWSGQ